MLATWRKRDLKSNEAGLKYYLMGVFASAIMLYGMSLLYGGAGSTLLTDINNAVSVDGSPSAIVVMGVIFVIIGFAFKVSAFPFHTWAPDTYEGAPTPVTASSRSHRRRPASWRCSICSSSASSAVTTCTNR